MLIIHNTPDKTLKPCATAIGFFDGVHLGHRSLIEQVKKEAAAKGICSALVTFPVHPRKVMNTDYKPELLTTYEEKIKLLKKTDIDHCFVLDFTPKLSQLTAEDFMRNILRNQYNVHSLIIGHDHRFGHNRSESFNEYCCYGNSLGIRVIQAQPYIIDDVTLSSSAIRRLLHNGDVKTAASYLGYEYFLDGTVIDGHKIGRTIGFPTANLHITHPDKLIPADGVYAVRVTFNGTEYAGMLNIGQRPTINNGYDQSIEVHILHFNSDIYNCPLRISFVQHIRSEIKFSGKEQLIEQLSKDAAFVEKLLL